MKANKKDKVEAIDVGLPEGREMLLQRITSIQRVERSIQVLKDELGDIRSNMKSEGFNVALINSVIANIRKELNKDEMIKMEEEVIEDVIKSVIEII